MPSSILAEMSLEELEAERRELESEIERRRWTELAGRPATSLLGDGELELMELYWYRDYQGELASDEEGRISLRWLWSCTVVSYQSQFDRDPLVGYIAQRVCDAIAALIYIDADEEGI